MARSSEQPPKKKHTNKPRQPPVIELSDADRESCALEAEQKAEIHLKEALSIAEIGKAPNATVHSAYYAMHFCAIAALYRAGGVGKRKDVPASHEHVIQHYIRLAEGLDDPFLKTSGALLNRARDDRVRADYYVGTDQTMTFGLGGANREEAVEAAAVAARFVQAWTTLWGDADPNRRRRSPPRDR